jgi:parallel beta-helix repeat protein
VRPPWQVAGVDYHVGVPTGMALQAPTAADLPAGVSISGQTIIVDASNVTLSGYDFSGNGGYGIYIDSGVSGTTIADNLFVDSSSSAPPAVVVGAGASNTTVENNTINGGGAGGNAGYGETIYNEGSGLTVEYNDIENVPQHFVTTSGGPLVDEFNLMENGAMAPGAHLNFLQYTGSESDPSSVIAYNTLVQSETDGGAGEGFQTYNNGSGAITNAVISNNTMVSLSDVLQSGAPGPAVSYWVHPNSSTSITDNYFGLNSAYGAIYPGQGAAESGNFNLATGGTL